MTTLSEALGNMKDVTKLRDTSETAGYIDSRPTFKQSGSRRRKGPHSAGGFVQGSPPAYQANQGYHHALQLAVRCVPPFLHVERVYYEREVGKS